MVTPNLVITTLEFLSGHVPCTCRPTVYILYLTLEMLASSSCLCRQLASSLPARWRQSKSSPSPRARPRPRPKPRRPPARSLHSQAGQRRGRSADKCSVAVQVSDRRRSSAAIHLRNVRSSHRHVDKAGAGLQVGPHQLGLHRDRWRGCRAAEAVAQWAGVEHDIGAAALCEIAGRGLSRAREASTRARCGRHTC